MKEYLSDDMILHEKDANIVFNDDWYYSDGMQRLGRNITSSINGNNVLVLKILFCLLIILS